MPKIFWYYCVIGIGLVMLIYTMYKKRNFLDLFSFFLAATSLGYLCEVIVLFVFDAYEYKPEVFSDPIAEDIFGHLTCNGLFWGGTAVLVAAFSLKFYWILFISISYVLVEVLFLKVGAYEHHWWKLYMTGVGSFIFFILIKRWFAGLQKSNRNFLRKYTFFMIAWVILQGTSVILSLLQKQHFTIGVVENIFRDSIMFSVPYQIILALIYVAFVILSQKWYWKVTPLLINLVMDATFALTNILIFKPGWNLLYLLLLRSVGFIIFILLEKYTLKLKHILK